MAGANRVVIDGVSYPIDDATAVDFEEQQTLTDAQKARARSNIGAASQDDMTSVQAAVGDVPSGSNLQGEVADLKSAINDITGISNGYNWIKNARINTSGDSVDYSNPSSNNYYDCLVVDCAAGDVFTLTGKNTNANYRLWCWCSTDGTVVSKPNTNLDYTLQKIVAPTGATKLIINVSNASAYVLYDGELLSSQLALLKSALPLKADQTATIRYLGVRISDGDVDGFYTMYAERNVSESGFISASGSVFLIPDIGWKSVTMAGAYSIYCCDENGVSVGTMWTRESGSDAYGIPDITVAHRGDNENAGYVAIYMTATAQLRHFAISTIDAPVPCPRTKQVESESYGRDVLFDYGRIRETENLSPEIDSGLALANGVSSSNAYCARGFGFAIPKGTRISTKNTALTCQIMGATSSGYVFISEADFNAGGKEYTFESDFFGAIYWRVGSWNVSEGAPTISAIGAFYFVRFVKPDSRWVGKTWYSFGTSISDVGVGDTAGNNGQRGKWPLCVDDFSGMTRINGAWGSNGIMSDSNLWNAIMSTPYSVDLVTLELGPNDDYWTRLGTVGDTGNDTFLGRLYQIYDYLTKNTRAQVVFVAVGGRQFAMDTTEIVPANGTWRNRYRTMVDAVKKLSDLFGIPVIDADANACNLNRRLNGIVMADYIHYTYLGGEMYGRYIWSRLERMEPYPVFNAPT